MYKALVITGKRSEHKT